MSILLKLFHVLAAIWFIAGLLGRNLTLAHARKTNDINKLSWLMPLVGRFDNLMVIPGSLAVLALGLLTAWADGYPLFGFLQRANPNWLLISLLLFLTVVALVPFVFLPRGRLFENALKDALVQNTITPQLKISLTDRVVETAHLYELAAIALIVILMVTRPF